MLNKIFKRFCLVNYFGVMSLIYRRLYFFYVKSQRSILKTKGIMPIRTFIFLTYRCNCVCYFCSTQFVPQEEMDLNDVKHISKQLPSGSIVTFIGGEPTLVKDFGKIIEYAAPRHRVRVDTNGSVFNKDKDLLKKMVDDGVWIIQFSIDAPNATHDLVRGPQGLFQGIVESIRELKRYRQEKRSITPLVHVNSVILKETIPFLPEMVRLCADLGVDSFEFGGLGNTLNIDSYVYTQGITKNKSYDQSDLILFKEKMNEAIELAGKLKVNLRIKPNVRTLLKLLNDNPVEDSGQILKKKIDMSGYFCPAPWSTVLIGPEGEVRMCDEYAVAVLGNIKTTP